MIKLLNYYSCECSCSNGNEHQEGGDNWWKRRWKLDTHTANNTSTLCNNPQNQGDNGPTLPSHYYDDCEINYQSSFRTYGFCREEENHNSRLDNPRQKCRRNSLKINSSNVCKISIRGSSSCSNSRSGANANRCKNLDMSFVTIFNFLVIFTALLTQRTVSFPTNDCDWSGSDTPGNVVQAVYLQCQRGQILWERPRGGLRVNISPPKYFQEFQSTENKAFRLCLESKVGSDFKVFLEQSGFPRDRRLLPFLSPDSSTCYHITSPTASLYVELQNQQQQEDPEEEWETRNQVPLYKEVEQVKISYEIEESKVRSGLHDDECRPCNDQEVLQLYCVADVVTKGEILSVKPSPSKRGMDTLHIKSSQVIHQNHPVFVPLKPGNKNLQKFLSQDITIFDPESPKKVAKSSKSSNFGGIVSHPGKCAAQSGPGEFLWLIKLSFGRPKIGCVIYWDKWVKIATEAEKSGAADCPLVY